MGAIVILLGQLDTNHGLNGRVIPSHCGLPSAFSRRPSN